MEKRYFLVFYVAARHGIDNLLLFGTGFHVGETFVNRLHFEKSILNNIEYKNLRINKISITNIKEVTLTDYKNYISS